jgi:hypothetical protein
MEAGPPESRVDARSVRFERVAIAILLLGAFVFQRKVVWVVPSLAVLLAVAVGFGARGNVFTQIFKAVVEGRLKPATTTEPAGAVRFSELFAVATLTVATLLFAVDLNPIAWLVTLFEAGISALHASTGLSVEAAVRDRLRGGHR